MENIRDVSIIDISGVETEEMMKKKEEMMKKREEMMKKREEMIEKRKEYIEKRKIEIINAAIRQTDYSYEIAEQKLIDCSFNIQKVLEEYHGIPPKKEENKTVNQAIYGEIRNLMDTGAKSFRMQQERMEYIKKIKEMQEAGKNNKN